jgi:hypothetical protein
MVAGGEGWTILTPLALHQARAFREAVEVRPLPFPALRPHPVAVGARGILRDVPGQIAAAAETADRRGGHGPGAAALPLGPGLRVL